MGDQEPEAGRSLQVANALGFESLDEEHAMYMKE